ncbi:MAG: helix-turn-helix transcriptional regulator [Rhodospirillales bacterium]|nr:helix-turn-helix transcriptional regulator [Rhodospirillales bacterium]
MHTPIKSDPINPETLQTLRKRRRLTQQQLADRIRCRKDTVSRWERGESGNVRSHLREPLARALGVSWDDLTRPMSGDPAPRDPGTTRLNERVSSSTKNNLDLVCQRFDVERSQVLDMAPLLFWLLAETSLASRQRQLDKFEEAFDQAEQTASSQLSHLEVGLKVIDSDGDPLVCEYDSLEKRDVFGRLLPATYADLPGPFVTWLREFCIQLPKERRPALADFGPGEVSYSLPDAALCELTGLEEGHDAIKWIQSGDIDLEECCRKRREHDEPTYKAWLSDRAAEVMRLARMELDQLLGLGGDDDGEID